MLPNTSVASNNVEFTFVIYKYYEFLKFFINFRSGSEIDNYGIIKFSLIK